MDKNPRSSKRKFVEHDSSEDEDIENGRPGTSSKKNKKMKPEAKLKKWKQYEEEDADDCYDWVDDKDDEDYLEPEDEWKENDAKRTKTKKMVRRDEDDSNDDDWEDDEDDDVSVNQPTTSKGKIIENDSPEEDEIDIGRAGTSSQQMKTKKKKAQKMKVVMEDEDSDGFCWKDYEKDDDWVKHVAKKNLVCPEQNCEVKIGYPSDLRKHLKRAHFANLSGKKLEERVRAACEEWIKARKLILEKANSKGLEKAPKDLKCCCEILDLPYNVSNLYCKGSEVCRIRPKERYFGLKRKGPEGEERQYWCNNCFQEAKKDGIVDVNQFVSMQNKILKSEDILECNGCQGSWHRCCTTHLGIRDVFWCDSCKKTEKPRIEMMSMEKGASFIEQRLNQRICEEVRDAQKIKILCCTTEKEALTRSLVPKHLGNEFVAKYGEKISYRTRATHAFQLQDDGDMIFFTMQTQEYIRPIRGDPKSFFVIQILDSVNYLQGADPPLKGDDYIFHVHPESQGYLDERSLIGWYRKMMDQGKAEWIIQKFEDFKKAMPGTIQPARDLPLFDGELWSKAMLASEKEKNFEKAMKEQYSIHANDNFFVELQKPKGKIGQLDPRLFRNKILENVDEFWKHLAMKNAEFVDRRRAVHSSLRVVKLAEKTKIEKVQEDRERERQV
ncbi:hypothetical protein L3Y34_019773 [Caenorhabditis briggsae]|uniref:histone acetyltransferase n=1 Tax=Caenorhabditis briggsae TaxID=6238 RepID=A0AAE9IX66_CAEBR|nr:hypothetical protein L3Y34_019773 [Caenorhabditis briggsae]